MPNYHDIYPAQRTHTYTSAFANVNAIKQSIATSTAAVTYSGAQLDGVLFGQTLMPFSQAITVTTAAHAGSYAIGASNLIVVTGLNHGGIAVTATVQLTAVNGGETVSSLLPIAQVTSIAIPAQNDALGSFQIGVGDILVTSRIRQIRTGAAGTIKIGYSGGVSDSIPCLQGERFDVLAVRVYDSGSSTAFPITLFA